MGKNKPITSEQKRIQLREEFAKKRAYLDQLAIKSTNNPAQDLKSKSYSKKEQKIKGSALQLRK